MTFPASKFSSAEELISALDWWREAGLDQDFADQAQSWLKADEPAVASLPEPAALVAAPMPPPAPPREKIGGDPSLWPQDLESFQAWWLAEPSLDAGQVHGRVPPRGPHGAELLVMVDYPEAVDSERLLSGPHGTLLNGIVAALGLDPALVYIASALPRHMPLPDWAALEAAGLGQLAQHHLALAAPKRVLAFGPHVSSLLGHDPAKSVQPQSQICRLGADLPALVAPELESLLKRPGGKARLWQALLDWFPV